MIQDLLDRRQFNALFPGKSVRMRILTCIYWRKRYKTVKSIHMQDFQNTVGGPYPVLFTDPALLHCVFDQLGDIQFHILHQIPPYSIHCLTTIYPRIDP